MSVILKSLGPVGLVCALVSWCTWPYLSGSDLGIDLDDTKAPQRITRARLNPPLSPTNTRNAFQPIVVQPPQPAVEEVVEAPPEPEEPKVDLMDVFGDVELGGIFIRGNRRYALIGNELWVQGEAKICSKKMDEPCIATLDSG